MTPLSAAAHLDINLYLVGPDSRNEKFVREVARPTFASRPKPLHSVCGFVPYSKLCERLREAKNVNRFLKPEFIDEIADFYDPADEVDRGTPRPFGAMRDRSVRRRRKLGRG
jgi:hypothetical protein